MIVAENKEDKQKLNDLSFKLLQDIQYLITSNIKDIYLIKNNFNRLFYIIDKYSDENYSILNYSLDSMSSLINVLQYNQQELLRNQEIQDILISYLDLVSIKMDMLKIKEFMSQNSDQMIMGRQFQIHVQSYNCLINLVYLLLNNSQNQQKVLVLNYLNTFIQKDKHKLINFQSKFLETNTGIFLLIENLSIDDKDLNEQCLKLLQSCVEDSEILDKIFKCKILSNVIQKFSKNQSMNNHLTSILDNLDQHSSQFFKEMKQNDKIKEELQKITMQLKKTGTYEQLCQKIK